MIKPLYYLNICYTELLKSRGSTKMPNEFDRTEIQKKHALPCIPVSKRPLHRLKTKLFVCIEDDQLTG